MEHFGAEINDKYLRLLGGLPSILMDGYQTPLAFDNGLPYLKCCTPTNEEVTSLPHVIMTSDIDWDPTSYNNDITDIIVFTMPVLTRYIAATLMTMEITIIALWQFILYMRNRSFLMYMSSLIT
jgi:hypothetical protein